MDDLYRTIVYGQDRDPDNITEIFHEASKFASANFMAQGIQIADYLRSPAWTVSTIANYKHYPTRRELTLPAPRAADLSLVDALERRCSVRAFSGQPIELQDLSNILFYGAGVMRTAAVANIANLQMRFRSYPSAGGLYPLELYAILLNVADTAPCVIHYNAAAGRAAVLSDGVELTTLRDAVGDRENFIPTIGAILLVTGIFQRATVKYGHRGYRFALLEAGHMAQNLSLLVTAQNLGCLFWGGYFDDRVNALIDANGVDEAVIHCMFVGCPNV
jgi:SagB-type dehydrogenase family enzyme